MEDFEEGGDHHRLEWLGKGPFVGSEGKRRFWTTIRISSKSCGFLSSQSGGQACGQEPHPNNLASHQESQGEFWASQNCLGKTWWVVGFTHLVGKVEILVCREACRHHAPGHAPLPHTQPGLFSEVPKMEEAWLIRCFLSFSSPVSKSICLYKPPCLSIPLLVEGTDSIQAHTILGQDWVPLLPTCHLLVVS